MVLSCQLIVCCAALWSYIVISIQLRVIGLQTAFIKNTHCMVMLNMLIMISEIFRTCVWYVILLLLYVGKLLSMIVITSCLNYILMSQQYYCARVISF